MAGMKKKVIKTKTKELESTDKSSFTLTVRVKSDKRKLTWGDKFVSLVDQLPTIYRSK